MLRDVVGSNPTSDMSKCINVFSSMAVKTGVTSITEGKNYNAQNL